MVGASANGVNEIYFSKGLGESLFYAAVAMERNASSFRRIESDLQISPRYQWFYYHDLLRHETNGDRIPDLYRVALHEFGHMIGFQHAEPESSFSVMRAHMSDVDDFTDDDLRDAKRAVEYLFRMNVPHFVWPSRSRTVVPRSRVVLRGHGSPFFIGVVTVKIFSESGLRKRRMVIGRAWSRPLSLEKGRNLLRFFYHTPDYPNMIFAWRMIRVR
jgi:hypothetical protein